MEEGLNSSSLDSEGLCMLHSREPELKCKWKLDMKVSEVNT